MTPMSAKTSQLQIRVSPQQKEALKRLARRAQLSVSEYVLARALPSSRLAFESGVAAVRSGEPKRIAVSSLLDVLAALPGAEFASTVAQIDMTATPEVPRNWVAACVEQEAAGRGSLPPSWASSTSPPEQPQFAGTLRSLRPYLMSVTPVAFKRRNLFLSAKPPSHAEGEPYHASSPGSEEAVGRFRVLDEELSSSGVMTELCLVGGLVVPLIFRSRPHSRRPASLFGAHDIVSAAVERTTCRLDLQENWVAPCVRRYADCGRRADRFYEGPSLRVYVAQAGYVLAMMCLRVATAAPGDSHPPGEGDGDVAYLLRFLNLSSPDDALELVSQYSSERQRAPDLAERFAELLTLTARA